MVNARKRVPILQLIGHEVDTPGLVRRAGEEAFFPVPYRLSLALWPFLQGQALFLVQPIHQMLPNLPALAV
jgi:hypothetical protein